MKLSPDAYSVVVLLVSPASRKSIRVNFGKKLSSEMSQVELYPSGRMIHLMSP